MTFFNEYGLLIAVALPVAVIAGMQVAALLAGERGTGLLPGFNSYPSIPLGRKSGDVVAMPVTGKPLATVESSNDAMERQAA